MALALCGKRNWRGRRKKMGGLLKRQKEETMQDREEKKLSWYLQDKDSKKIGISNRGRRLSEREGNRYEQKVWSIYIYLMYLCQISENSDVSSWPRIGFYQDIFM